MRVSQLLRERRSARGGGRVGGGRFDVFMRRKTATRCVHKRR